MSTETGELYSVADALMLSGGYWYNEDILKAAGIERKYQKVGMNFKQCVNRLVSGR